MDIRRGCGDLTCNSCQAVFPIKDGRPDFRLRMAVERTLSFAVGSNRPDPSTFPFTYPMPKSSQSWIQQAQWRKLKRPQVSLLSYIPEPTEKPAFALDLGCGSAKDREFIEEIGYTYVGCDPFNENAPMLADAHALPFKDASLMVVFALTVMEHFQNPFIATAEVNRILKPAGRFIGTVEQLVPFHMDSFYNMTQFGIYNVLVQSGMHPVCVSPATGWTGLVAIYGGSYWRGTPAWLRNSLAVSQDSISRILWRLRARIKREPTDQLYREWMLKFAGGFKFVAEKL